MQTSVWMMKPEFLSDLTAITGWHRQPGGGLFNSVEPGFSAIKSIGGIHIPGSSYTYH